VEKVNSPKSRKSKTSRTAGISEERLDELVDEATIDANGESEQATGFYTMMANDLELPFETEVLGVQVTVEAIDFAGDDRLVAVGKKGSKRQRISLKDCAQVELYPSLLSSYRDSRFASTAGSLE
jgi:hypothetical protein